MFRSVRGRRRRVQRLQVSQQLEVRALLASVMDSGTTLQIQLEQNERVEVVSNGANYELTSTTSTFTNAGVTDAADFSAFGSGNVTLNDLTQYTDVQIVDVATNSSVRFPDRGTGVFSHNFDIALDDGATPPSIVINGPAHFGIHNLTVNTDGSILVFNGSDLSVSDGDISLTAVNSTDGSAAPRGISVVDGKITTTGSGDILLTGTGASSAELNGLNGVSVQFDSLISSTSTLADAGTIVLTGTGGVGADFVNGVFIEESSIVSANGDISIIGIGGNGSGNSQYGIRTRAATIESTGAGDNAAKILLDGTGGDADSFLVGLGVFEGSVVRSVDGDISWIGRGGRGTGGNNAGLLANDFVLESTGTGANAAKISVHGIGGSGTNGNSGVSLSGDDSVIRSVEGAISLLGDVGLDSTEHGNSGIWVSASVLSTGLAPIDITGIGGVGSQFNRGVAISGASTVVSSDSAPITITGTGGSTTLGSGRGVEVINAATIVSDAGSISITGRGGDGGSYNQGIRVSGSATIRSTGTGANPATIVLDGTGGTGEDWNSGVVISGAAVVASIDGEVNIIGVGGDASGHSNRGVDLSGFNRIESTGTGEHAARIYVVGTGGNGSGFNGGVRVSSSDTSPGTISSIDGDIQFDGKTGQVLTQGGNTGVTIKSAIRSTGDGNLIFNGTATFGTQINRGVFFTDTANVSTTKSNLVVTGIGGRGTGNENEGVVVSNQVTLTTSSGFISLNGTSGTNNSHGVEIWGNADSGGKVLSTGSGGIEIVAGGEGTGEKDDFRAYTNAVIGGPTAAGDISIKSDTITLSENVAIQSSGNLVIAPMTDGLETQTISLGFESAVSRTDLNLTDDELQRLQPGFASITIGTPGLAGNRNPVTVESVQLPPETTVVGDTITLVDTYKPGRLQLTGDVLFDGGSAFTVEVAGVQPGAGFRQYDQIVSTGPVDIQAGAELDVSRSAFWRPSGSEQITIVSRDGGSGTFVGLPEGAVLPEFLNSTISYVGGDGDDIVLTLPAVIATQQTQIHNLPTGAGESLRPLISWNAVAGADSYRVFIGNSTQQTRVLDTIVTGASMTPDVDLAFGRNLIWVQPIGGEFIGKWSEPVGYSVAPQLLSPVTSTLKTRPEFTWGELPGVESMQIYIQKGSTVVVNESGVTGTSYSPSVELEVGNYSWWIRPSAANGNVGTWSARGTFNVGGQTTILGPDATVDNGLATVEWEPVDGAAWYEIYLLNDDTGIVQRKSGLTETSFDTAPLAEGDHRVWVRSYHSDGSPALWSRVHRFAVSSPAGNLNATPADAVVSTFDPTPTFAWTADAAATSFNLYLSNGDAVIHQSSITENNWTPTTPLQPARWTWWVQPVTAAGLVGEWSFSGTVDTSGRAVLANNVGVSAGRATFNWSSVAGADHYVLQVTDSGTAESVLREENLTSLAHTTIDSLPAGTYRAWVRAVSSDGSFAPWSIGVSFVVS